ncbi:efflux RND transporter permease subunit [Shigella flexneri]
MARSLPPKEATRKWMRQIQGALVGYSDGAVSGIYTNGVLRGVNRCNYRQFSITIVSAMALSVLVALILTPALCATMLKPIAKGDHGEGERLLRLV